jgi:hypothetical protein
VMARKLTVGHFGPAQTRSVVPGDLPERRSVYLESLLCIAIRKRVLVKLQLKEYIAERLFEPTVVYLSSKHQLCVTGIQFVDPEKPLNNAELRNFEVDEMRNVFLTERAFFIDPVIDPFDGKYVNGIICSTYRPNPPLTCISGRRKR